MALEKRLHCTGHRCRRAARASETWIRMESLRCSNCLRAHSATLLVVGVVDLGRLRSSGDSNALSLRRSSRFQTFPRDRSPDLRASSAPCMLWSVDCVSELGPNEALPPWCCGCCCCGGGGGAQVSPGRILINSGSMEVARETMERIAGIWTAGHTSFNPLDAL